MVTSFIAIELDHRNNRDPYGVSGASKLATWAYGGGSVPTTTLCAIWDEVDGTTCPYNLEPLMKPKVDPTAAPEILKGVKVILDRSILS